MATLLEVRSLTVEYGTAGPDSLRAVDDLSFHVESSETVGLMGESGCGKSSTALALLGLLKKEQAKVSGSIVLCGCELRGFREPDLERLRGSKISLVFQEPDMALNPMMCVGDQIAEVIHAHRRWNWKRCRGEAAAVLECVGLESTSRIFGAYPHQLSGGQRQRIVLAQAIACNPELLVADEPTASLDAKSQSEFIALLRKLKKDMGLAVLLISHSPELQAQLTDRLLIMKDGRIIERGGFESLFENPIHEYTRMILRPNARPAKTVSMPTAELEEQFTR